MLEFVALLALLALLGLLFFETNEVALADIKRCAAEEAALP